MKPAWAVSFSTACQGLTPARPPDPIDFSSEEEWARGDANTNSIENAWSLFKRSIVGSFHQISSKHVEAYLDEFEWRFNNRSNPYLFEDTMIRLLNAKPMEFAELITKGA